MSLLGVLLCMCIAFLIYLQSSSAEAFCSYVNMYQIKEASSFILCIFATIALHWLCPRCLVEVERSRRRPGDQSPLTLRFRGLRFGISQWPPPPRSSTTLIVQVSAYEL